MTNTPSPTDEDRELIERLRKPGIERRERDDGYPYDEKIETTREALEAADRLESLLSARAKLEEALSEAKLQLEYLESRWPTGTTPPIITRIERALNRTAG